MLLLGLRREAMGMEQIAGSGNSNDGFLFQLTGHSVRRNEDGSLRLKLYVTDDGGGRLLRLDLSLDSATALLRDLGGLAKLGR